LPAIKIAFDINFISVVVPFLIELAVPIVILLATVASASVSPRNWIDYHNVPKACIHRLPNLLGSFCNYSFSISKMLLRLEFSMAASLVLSNVLVILAHDVSLSRDPDP
jgi:hypothetical protein